MVDNESGGGPCEDWAGYVRHRGGGVLVRPTIVPIYWSNSPDRPDHPNPEQDYVIEQMSRFFRYIEKSPFIAGLEQYGVRPDEVMIRPSVLVIKGAPRDVTLTRDQIVKQLRQWMGEYKWLSGPASLGISDRDLERATSEWETRQGDLLFVIFTPPRVAVEFQGRRSPEDIVAYHHWDYRDPTKTGGRPDLFFSVIGFPCKNGQVEAPFTAARDDSLVDVLTQLASNEIAEALTDCDGTGYKNEGGCEICDICESDRDPFVRGTRVDGWLLQTYWSNEHQACVVAAADNSRAGTTNDRPLRTMMLFGYVRSKEDSRLYFDPSLTRYIKYKAEDIIASEDVPTDLARQPAKRLWLRSDIELEFGIERETASAQQPIGRTLSEYWEAVRDMEERTPLYHSPESRVDSSDKAVESFGKSLEASRKILEQVQMKVADEIFDEKFRATGAEKPHLTYLSGPIHKTYLEIARLIPVLDDPVALLIGNAPTSGCASESGFCPSQGGGCAR